MKETDSKCRKYYLDNSNYYYHLISLWARSILWWLLHLLFWKYIKTSKPAFYKTPVETITPDENNTFSLRIVIGAAYFLNFSSSTLNFHKDIFLMYFVIHFILESHFLTGHSREFSLLKEQRIICNLHDRQ